MFHSLRMQHEECAAMKGAESPRTSLSAKFWLDVRKSVRLARHCNHTNTDEDIFETAYSACNMIQSKCSMQYERRKEVLHYAKHIWMTCWFVLAQTTTSRSKSKIVFLNDVFVFSCWEFTKINCADVCYDWQFNTHKKRVNLILELRRPVTSCS